jgi:hypothetical protein
VRVIGLLLLLPSPALAGDLSGTIRLEGPPHDFAVVPIAKDASVCGRQAAHDMLIVDRDGGLANVVVAIKGLKAPAPPTKGASVDQVGCRYAPHVQALTVGSELAVLNNDAVLHNVHGTIETGASPLTVFNVAMPFKGGKSPQVLKKPGAIKLRCDAGHTWMSAYVHVFDHPFFAVTDEKGRFTIKDVPPGKYTVELWHEPIADKQAPIVHTATVEVSDGKTATLDTAFAF